MDTAVYKRLTSEERDGVVTVTLNRPDVRNAFDVNLILELKDVFTKLSANSPARCVVLRGAGKSFSAGADINWMRESVDLDEEANRQGALRMQEMFQAIDECALPVVGQVHGAALGGGSGLVACCDIVIAAADTKFGFSEVRLGIIPAVISPFVLSKIGQSNARRLFLTGERFDAAEAVELGLLARALPEDALDAAVEAEVAPYLDCAPGAVARAKALLRDLGPRIDEDVIAQTVDALADCWAGDEAPEGIGAFFDKRVPRWRG